MESLYYTTLFIDTIPVAMAGGSDKDERKFLYDEGTMDGSFVGCAFGDVYELHTLNVAEVWTDAASGSHLQDKPRPELC